MRLALDLAADEAMRESQTQESRDRALDMKRLLTDGVCRITDVKDKQDYPCVGEIWTDLGERFPVFQVYTREQARALIGKRVKLTIHMSEKGSRYVTDMMAMPVDVSTEVWPCPKCGGTARCDGGRRDGIWIYFYICPVCSYQMEVGP